MAFLLARCLLRRHRCAWPLGDIGIAPKISATEGSGKLLAYMAASLPVVAFDTPVHREYLGNMGLYAAGWRCSRRAGLCLGDGLGRLRCAALGWAKRCAIEPSNASRGTTPRVQGRACTKAFCRHPLACTPTMRRPIFNRHGPGRQRANQDHLTRQNGWEKSPSQAALKRPASHVRRHRSSSLCQGLTPPLVDRRDLCGGSTNCRICGICSPAKALRGRSDPDCHGTSSSMALRRRDPARHRHTAGLPTRGPGYLEKQRHRPTDHQAAG